MADRNVFGLIEDGQFLTAPNLHIDLAGTIPAAAYIGKLFDAEMATAETASITIRKDQANWSVYSGAVFTFGVTDSFDLSGATLVRSAGTINNSDSVVVMGLEPIPPDAGDVYFARKNGLLADISELYLTAVEDDTAPTLGGHLTTGGANAYDIVYTDTADVVRGLSGTTTDNKIFLARTDDAGNYNEDDGGVLARAGALELHGANVEIIGLTHSDASGYQNLNISTDGVVFGASPPASGWVETDISATTIAIPNTATWTRITGLEITVPQDVAAGDIVEAIAKMWMVNSSNNKNNTVSLGLGIDAAPPTASGTTLVIVGGFAGYMTYGLTVAAPSGATAGQTVAVWMQVTTGTGDITADGSVNNHDLIVSVPAGGGTGEVNSATNLGTGVELAVETNSGVFIPFRSFVNTATVTWTQNADDVTATVPTTTFDARYIAGAGTVADGNLAVFDGTDGLGVRDGGAPSVGGGWTQGTVVENNVDATQAATSGDVDVETAQTIRASQMAGNTTFNFTFTALNAGESRNWSLIVDTNDFSPTFTVNGGADLDLTMDFIDLAGAGIREFNFISIQGEGSWCNGMAIYGAVAA